MMLFLLMVMGPLAGLVGCCGLSRLMPLALEPWFNPEAAQGTWVMSDATSYYRVRLLSGGRGEARLHTEAAANDLKAILKQTRPALGLRDWLHFGLLYGPDAILMPPDHPLSVVRATQMRDEEEAEAAAAHYRVLFDGHLIGTIALYLPSAEAVPFRPIEYETLPVPYPIPQEALQGKLGRSIPLWAPFLVNTFHQGGTEEEEGISIRRDLGDLRVIKFFHLTAAPEVAHLLIGERGALRRLKTDLRALDDEDGVRVGELEAWCLGPEEPAFAYERRPVAQNQVIGVRVWSIHPREDRDGSRALAALLTYPQDGQACLRRCPAPAPNPQETVKRDSVLFLLALLLLIVCRLDLWSL